MSASKVYDIILLCLFVYNVWHGWRQGILSVIVRLAGWTAAIMLPPVLVKDQQALPAVLVFLVCLVASRFLANLVTPRRKGGILSQTNRILGLALGIGEGLLTAYVFVFILTLWSTFAPSSIISRQILHNTFFVRLFL